MLLQQYIVLTVIYYMKTSTAYEMQMSWNLSTGPNLNLNLIGYPTSHITIYSRSQFYSGKQEIGLYFIPGRRKYICHFTSAIKHSQFFSSRICSTNIVEQNSGIINTYKRESSGLELPWGSNSAAPFPSKTSDSGETPPPLSRHCSDWSNWWPTLAV